MTQTLAREGTRDDLRPPVPPSGTRPAPTRRGALPPALRLGAVGALALALLALYLLHDLPTGRSASYLVQRRVTTLATFAVVACAISTATVLFHTVTANRILTPSIMGLDALYLALQTASVFFLGATGATAVHPAARFLVTLVAMVGASVLLFRWLLVGMGRGIHLMVLVGVLLGGLLRGVSSFLQRLLDPEAFAVLSDRFFADFTGADPRLLGISALAVGATCAWVWRRRRMLDVMALGPALATGLGVDHRRESLRVLVASAVLVGVATALVGPTMFFGLLVAHLAYRLAGSHRHAWTLPCAALLGLVCLAAGQLVMERMLGFEGSLSMVVEFVGGVVFIALVLRGRA